MATLITALDKLSKLNTNLMKVSPEVLIVLSDLGKGDEPSEKVLQRVFLLSVLLYWYPNWSRKYSQVMFVKKNLKDEQGVDKLPPTRGGGGGG